MPAIASLEDLKAAQKEGLGIYAMPYLSFKVPQGGTKDGCPLLYAFCVGFGFRSGPQSN